MVRVFLVDNNDLVRFGLKSVLHNDSALEIVGEARDAASALAAMDSKPVDVVLVDMDLPDSTGIEFCRRLHADSRDIKCVIFASTAEAEIMTQAALSGAAGYLTSNLPGEIITRAIHTVSAGRLAFDHRVTEVLIRHVRREKEFEHALGELTPRELKLFHLVSDGLSNHQISQAIDLAEKTVRNNLTALYAKLGVENRSQLVTLAAKLREGILPTQPHVPARRAGPTLGVVTAS
ncbi:response regulator transcription factor [Nocardia inohanensis]|uniref:response regulator transcription factor n=1 Tax=Nocardia inohanensis TaxID=209246 RepID=UPI0008336C4F|nr:response regulator transcription factor [Nocardia inohanensis]